jgi:hypothetical protein
MQRSRVEDESVRDLQDQSEPALEVNIKGAWYDVECWWCTKEVGTEFYDVP